VRPHHCWLATAAGNPRGQCTGRSCHMDLGRRASRWWRGAAHLISV